MAPEAPLKTKDKRNSDSGLTQKTHLFQLLRKEFIRKHERPVSSDCLLKIASNAVDKEELYEASKKLHNITIPEFAINIVNKFKKSILKKKSRFCSINAF